MRSKRRVEEMKFYGKTKQEVMELLGSFPVEYENEEFHFMLSTTWYGKRETISLIFHKNRVEEKYINRI